MQHLSKMFGLNLHSSDEIHDQFARKLALDLPYHPQPATCTPVLTIVSPMLTIVSPMLTIVSPMLTIVSPMLTIVSPMLTIVSPMLTIVSPMLTIVSPMLTTVSQPNITVSDLEESFKVVDKDNTGRINISQWNDFYLQVRSVPSHSAPHQRASPLATNSRMKSRSTWMVISGH
jgi:hypothetical protein